MWKKIGISFSLAGLNIQSRLFHTFLPILGIVIGVAALVAVLYLIDGLENMPKQAVQGFLLFRVIMGLIVGIWVVVGGIGVMNVLLISVTERTVEIGV